MRCLWLPYGLIKEVSSPGRQWNGDFKSFFTRFCRWWQIQILVIQAEEGNKNLVLIQLFLGNSCRFIAKPCAINLGIQDSGPHRAQPNAILEKVFTSITKVSHTSNSSSIPKGMEAWKCLRGAFASTFLDWDAHFTLCFHKWACSGFTLPLASPSGSKVNSLCGEPWFCAQKNLWDTNVPLITRPELLPLVPCLWCKLDSGDSWFYKRFPSIFHFNWESVPLFLELGSFSDFIGFIVNVFLSFLSFTVNLDSSCQWKGIIQGGVQSVEDVVMKGRTFNGDWRCFFGLFPSFP